MGATFRKACARPNEYTIDNIIIMIIIVILIIILMIIILLPHGQAGRPAPGPTRLTSSTH